MDVYELTRMTPPLNQMLDVFLRSLSWTGYHKHVQISDQLVEYARAKESGDFSVWAVIRKYNTKVFKVLAAQPC